MITLLDLILGIALLAVGIFVKDQYSVSAISTARSSFWRLRRIVWIASGGVLLLDGIRRLIAGF